MSENKSKLIGGIDYGSKLAGTTVLVVGDVSTRQVSFYQAKPRQDADAFLMQAIRETQVLLVLIDAPLSLPGVYRDLSGYEDYFYRAADRELQAMSPLFLGGLTARAMRLQNLLQRMDVKVFETYPSIQAKRMQLTEIGYKKTAGSIGQILARIQVLVPEWTIPKELSTWHQVDALLAMIAAYRFSQGVCLQAGNEQEGIIYW